MFGFNRRFRTKSSPGLLETRPPCRSNATRTREMKSPKCLRRINTISKYLSSINHDQSWLIMVSCFIIHNQHLINKGLTLHKLQITALLTSVNELLKTLSIQTITFPSKNVLDYVGLRLPSNFGRLYASAHDKTFKNMKDIDPNDGTNNTLPSDLWVDGLASCHFYFDKKYFRIQPMLRIQPLVLSNVELL